MADTGKHVFISIGNRYTAEQKAFLQALIALLMQCGVTPRIMNSGKDYATDNFLKNIQTVMRECHGAIVVAFERKFFPTGTEKRGSSKERSLTNCTFPTPWNQIEAAMALALEIPIFVLSENGLHREGVLEQSGDWYVEDIDIRSENLVAGDAKARIEAWCDKLQPVPPARARTALAPIDRDTTLVQLIGRLTIPGMLQALAIVSAVFGGGVAAGKWLQPPTPAASLTQPSK